MYYLNTTREICIGDEVICHGVCDGVDLRNCRGQVRDVHYHRASGGYVAYVRFYERPSEYCGEWWVRIGNITHIEDYVEVAPSGAPICHRCGCVIEDTAFGSRLFKKATMCDACISTEYGKVNPYHSAKDGMRYNITPDKITMGCEIEIDAYDEDENDADANAVIRDVINCAHAYKYPLIMTFERDGSLNGGMECVTAPLTLDEWKRDFAVEQLRTLFRSAENNGFPFSEYDHAGLHIHIGRKDLCGTDRTVGDAVGLLMGWAVTRLWDDGFRRLSRRDNLEYCHLFNEYGDGNGLFDTEATRDRYYAVNIQNTKTIELRIFKGASCYEDVAVALDVCYMLAKWATKKINAFLKRNSYSAKSRDFRDALAYADRITWSALVKYSKYPEITLPRMRECGINV